MPKKKFYAVKKGRTTGIFHTWAECKASVDGYPAALYKSFLSEEAANEYLSGTGQDSLPFAQETEEADRTNKVTAYVDGSFEKKLGRYSFGCVLIKPDGEIVRESGNGSDPQSAQLRNVTGEMLGAMFAVKWCAVNGYRAVELCYDYMGIEMWAVGGWQAKNRLTQQYAQFMQEYGRKLHITFRKIAAHTGDRYNEEADQLAKAALTEGNGIPKIRNEETGKSYGVTE